jgi:hypothetical protein
MYKSMEFWWNNTDRVKFKYLDRSCASDTLYTTNPTMTSQELNQGLEGEREKNKLPKQWQSPEMFS